MARLDGEIEEHLNSQVSFFDIGKKETIFTATREEAQQAQEYIVGLRGGWAFTPDQRKDSFVERFCEGLISGESMKDAPKEPVKSKKAWPSLQLAIVSPAPEIIKSRTSSLIVDSLMEEETTPPLAPSLDTMPDFLGNAGTVVSAGGCLTMGALNQAFACLELHSVVVAAVVTNSMRFADIRSWDSKHYDSPPYSVQATRGVFGRVMGAVDVYVRNVPDDTPDSDYSTVWCLSMPDERYPRGLASCVKVYTGI